MISFLSWTRLFRTWYAYRANSRRDMSAWSLRTGNVVFISCAAYPALHWPRMGRISCLLPTLILMDFTSSRIYECPLLSPWKLSYIFGFVGQHKERGEEQHKCNCRSTQNVFYRNQYCTQPLDPSMDLVEAKPQQRQCSNSIGMYWEAWRSDKRMRFENGSFTPPSHAAGYTNHSPDSMRRVGCDATDAADHIRWWQWRELSLHYTWPINCKWTKHEILE